MFFDTHAHYDDKAFDEDRDSLLAALPEAGVTLVIDPGCDVKSSRAAIELAARSCIRGGRDTPGGAGRFHRGKP